MHPFRKLVLEYHSYTNGEKRGLIILATLILFLWAVIEWWPDPKPPELPSNLQEHALIKQQAHGPDPEKSLTLTDSSGEVNPAPSAKYRISQRSVRKQEVKPDPVEINTASAETFQKLPGIGSVLSGRIVKYRDLLGGFSNINQLYEVYGLDSAVVNQNKKLMKLEVVPEPHLHLNDSDFRTLLRHPYFSLELVKSIANSRRDSPFQNNAELVERGLVTPELYAKIAPYLIAL
ncbi:MAG: helix-hairpin-helix domain-containing protein [Flavobacteriales bacterium]|nr:helix-hairpin-helix domain-containing protein [Flavobacteriales bacterium]